MTSFGINIGKKKHATIIRAKFTCDLTLCEIMAGQLGKIILMILEGSRNVCEGHVVGLFHEIFQGSLA
jgi:hypothetical protein